MTPAARERGFTCPVSVAAGLLVLFAVSAGRAGEAVPTSSGQTLYVPAYSHVFHGDRNQPFYLTVTLTVRNPNPSHTVTVQAADYYDSKGVLVRKYVKDPVPLSPLSSVEFVIQETDRRGGPGAGFLLRWKAAGQVIPPVVESVMIGTAAAQGISFVSGARVIEESGP